MSGPRAGPYEGPQETGCGRCRRQSEPVLSTQRRPSDVRNPEVSGSLGWSPEAHVGDRRPMARDRSHLGLFCHRQSVVHFDTAAIRDTAAASGCRRRRQRRRTIAATRHVNVTPRTIAVPGGVGNRSFSRGASRDVPGFATQTRRGFPRHGWHAVPGHVDFS